MFRRLDSVSGFSWNIVRWAQWKEISVSVPDLLGQTQYVQPEDGDRIQTGRWINSRILIVISIYHHQKPTDSINLLVS
jgi:hypothetical protein